MRKRIALILAMASWLTAMGQPSNDHCNNALILPLEPVPACPAYSVVSTNISADNTGATPSEPYLVLSDHFGSGQELGSSIADVWYTLEPTANRLSIQVDGALEEPVLVLFQGDNCDEQIPVGLLRGAGKLEANVEPGQRYWLMAGGASLADQGPFTLTVQNFNDCSTCGQRQGVLRAWPVPENGRYEAGQTVQFCYEGMEWDPGNELEWLHSIQIAFGPGWDLSTLATTPPASCSAPAGQWAWYDSWESCMTGQSYGPGFAYDSPLGLLCPGGNTLDGNPGNNFGDGPCGSFFAGPLPLQFCWSVQVSNNFTTMEESNLNLEITLLGDANSGSWMPASCTPAPATRFLATAVPAAALLPDIELLQPPCGNNCNGELAISGNLDSSWSYTLRNAAGDIAFSTNAQAGYFSLAGLCAGQYRLNISNDSLGFTQSALMEIVPRPFPQIQLDYLPSCTAGIPGQILTGTTNSTSGPVSYFWLGPEGFFSNEASPEVLLPGLYTLHPYANNCQGQPLNIDIPGTVPEVQCTAGGNTTTFYWDPLPQDTAYELQVLSGQSGTWLSPTSFQVEGLAPGEAVSIALSAYGEGLCPLSYTEASCMALPCAPTALAADTVICPGGQAQLWVEAPAGSAISWSHSVSLSCEDCPAPVAQPAETTTYSVTITTPEGCTATQAVTVALNNLPTDILPDEPYLFCPGEAFTICLPPENSYLWISPIGFITTGSCLKFVNPTPGIAGLYRVRVLLPGGCQFTETLVLQLDEGCPPDDGTLLPPWMATNSPETALKAFPNPARSELQVQLPFIGKKKLALLTPDGRPVLQMKTDAPSLQIPVTQLPAGAYLLQVITEQGVESLPVAIVR